MRYLVNLSYDGSHYYGYQVQNNKPSIEGELEKNLSKIFNEKIVPKNKEKSVVKKSKN